MNNLVIPILAFPYVVSVYGNSIEIKENEINYNLIMHPMEMELTNYIKKYDVNL